MWYVENEDRLMLDCTSINNERSIFFITRRITRKIIKLLAHVLVNSSQAMAKAPINYKTEVLIFEHLSAVQSENTPNNSEFIENYPSDIDKIETKYFLTKLDVQIFAKYFKLHFYDASVKKEYPVDNIGLHRLLSGFHKMATLADWNLESEVVWLKDAETPQLVEIEKAAS
jgi:hypothetical protein